MRGIIRSGCVLSLLGVLVCGVVAVGAAWASTTVTIGQVAAGTSCVSSGFTYIQAATDTGPGYSVPVGKWEITSWSTMGYGSQMGLMVVGPTGTAGYYTVVGESPVVTLSATSSLQTYASPIAVQPGDLLGYWHPPGTFLGNCGQFSDPGNQTSYAYSNSEPGITTTISTYPQSGYLLDISATLSSTWDVQLAALLTAVTGSGPGTSLADKVNQVTRYADAGDTADACGTLGAFINQVKAQTNKTLTPAQAASFTAQAQAIRATLGC